MKKLLDFVNLFHYNIYKIGERSYRKGENEYDRHNKNIEEREDSVLLQRYVTKDFLHQVQICAGRSFGMGLLRKEIQQFIRYNSSVLQNFNNRIWTAKGR